MCVEFYVASLIFEIYFWVNPVVSQIGSSSNAGEGRGLVRHLVLIRGGDIIISQPSTLKKGIYYGFVLIKFWNVFNHKQ